MKDTQLAGRAVVPNIQRAVVEKDLIDDRRIVILHHNYFGYEALLDVVDRKENRLIEIL